MCNIQANGLYLPKTDALISDKVTIDMAGDDRYPVPREIVLPSYKITFKMRGYVYL